MPAPRNEQKYQMLKLIHSGRTLVEAKALMKAASAGLDPEYTSAKDLKELAALEGINHLLLTRPKAVELMELKLASKKPRAYPSTRAESIAKFASGYRGAVPLDWKRDGNLIRKGPPNKPQPGSSAGKIGKTVVVGASQTLKDFDQLVDTLLQLQRQHGKGSDKEIRKAFKTMRKTVSTGGAKR